MSTPFIRDPPGCPDRPAAGCSCHWALVHWDFREETSMTRTVAAAVAALALAIASGNGQTRSGTAPAANAAARPGRAGQTMKTLARGVGPAAVAMRSEEHTPEIQAL